MPKSSVTASVSQALGTHRRIARLRRSALPLDTAALARFLLGKIVVRELPRVRLAGRIVETEAYVQGDAACHAYRGETPRNKSLFKRPGHAYVYLCYGTSFMLNVSNAAAGVGEGVLIRAIEPLSGVEHMQAHRGTDKFTDLGRGPGRLAAALALDLSFDGLDLTRPGPLWLGSDGYQPERIETSTRIGLTKAAHLPLRFFVAANRHVSGPRPRAAARAAPDSRATTR